MSAHERTIKLDAALLPGVIIALGLLGLLDTAIVAQTRETTLRLAAERRTPSV